MVTGKSRVGHKWKEGRGHRRGPKTGWVVNSCWKGHLRIWGLRG
jgi:hypothetical protein